MSIQFTIIGLGQIGTSMGLALGEQEGDFVRIGHDRDPGEARQAQQLGAVDKVHVNLYRSIRGADVVVLALPLDQVQATLPLIGTDLKPNTVVMDTAPIKAQVAEWARQSLPPDRHYVGLVPVLNPAYLHGNATGVESAQVDLFNNGLMGIVTPPGTDSAAIKLAVDFTTLMGATPLFVDPVEVDSLMAATHILPHLLAAAMLEATVDQPGWLEARKFAGRAYAQVTSPLESLDRPAAVGGASRWNAENVVRVLDNLIASLGRLRTSISEQEEEALLDHLETAGEWRSRWWHERVKAEWAQPPSQKGGMLPDVGFIQQLFLGRRPPRKKP